MRKLQHVLFWLAVLIVLTSIFKRSFGAYGDSLIFVVLLMPVIVGTSYFFNYYLVPRYLLKRRFRQFALNGLYMLIVSLYLEMLVITLSFIFLADYHHENLGTFSGDIFILAIALYFVVLLFTFIVMTKRKFTDTKSIEKLKSEEEKRKVGFLTIRVDRKQHRISFFDILYIESLADYVRVHRASDKPLVTKERISHLEKKLPEVFIRIHRSFIVNKNNIDSFTKEEVTIADTNLPISRSYKKKAIDGLSN